MAGFWLDNKSVNNGDIIDHEWGQYGGILVNFFLLIKRFDKIIAIM